MFGSVGHLNADGATFQYTPKDQFNSESLPQRGMVGPKDPQFNQVSEGRDRPLPSTPMFRHIGRLSANDGSFDYAGDSQYNYRGHPEFTRQNDVAQAVEALPVADLNSPLPSSPGGAPAVTTPSNEGLMFGRIDYAETKGALIRGAGGVQINLQNRPRREAPVINCSPTQHSSIFVQAARVTWDIKRGVQNALPNDNYFADLADRACNLVQSEWNESQIIGRQLDQKTVTNLVNLVQKLWPIAEFLINVDVRNIADNRERLKAALLEYPHHASPPAYSR